jgi:GT2 family glycosyltransferase
MTIWFAILTHNRPDSLLRLLQSIDEQKLPDGCRKQIVIWDNASSDANRQQVLAAAGSRESDLQYVYSPRNLFMVAKYELERLVLSRCDDSSDFCAHLDDDVTLEPGWVAAALDAIDRHGFDVCGSVEPYNGTLVVSGQSEILLRDVTIDQMPIRCWDWRWEPVGDREVCEVVFAGHRALLARMCCVRKVQHSENLLIGGEDLDYSLALRKAGFRLCISRYAEIRHRPGGETEITGFRTSQRVLESWQHFYKKWGFVRMNACREIGMSTQDWIRLFSEEQHAAAANVPET